MDPVQNPPTRRRILELLKRHGHLTVESLAEALCLTPMAVRQHLAVLQKEGLVGCSQRRGTIGRPAYLFYLTETGDEVFPRAYDRFAVELLEAIGEAEGPARLEQAVQQYVERMTRHYERQLTSTSVRERTNELAQLRNRQGYMAEVVQDGEGVLVLRQYNCAIARIARRFPVTCRCEVQMFAQLLGVPVSCSTRIVDGHTCCEHVIQYLGDDREAIGASRTGALS
ncbi:MAG: ArsR family transcriptional regulator [Clostridia bacterium]|nr:ArsR family transcriptional regulator [Clostridia bacterium]